MFSKGRPCRTSRLGRGKVGQTVNLERVLGFTSGNNCSVSFDTKASTIFYTAGCVVVAESCTTGLQSFIQSPSRKSLTCLDASPDGQFLATGEFGHQPKVRLWSRANHCQVAEFSSHHFRVSCVRFCPNSRNLVSVGNQDDQTICVWDRVQLQKIASAKVTAKVNALAFSEDGDFFVTVGIRHTKETQPLKGRNAVLNDMLNNTFTDVCCVNPFSIRGTTGGSQQSPEGPNLTLVVSQAGHLIQFNKSRQLTKWVDLKLFLKRAPTSYRVDEPRTPRYPDVITVKLDFSQRVLVCMYADHSLHCWDLKNLTSISRRFSHFYHSRPVNSVGMAALCRNARIVGTAGSADSTPTEEASPVRRFATCSDDGTVRLWTFNLNESTLKSTELFPDGKESVAVIYSDQLFTTLCADERFSAGFGPSYFGSGSIPLSTPSSPALAHRLQAKWESSTSLANLATDAFSLRSLAVSPDGQHLAVGDKAGSLRQVALLPLIYDLKTSKLLHSIPAHETEILCLSYFQSTSVPEMCLLCSTSRDRVIHVFEPRQSYSLVQTLADHSGSITAARFVENVDTREIYLFSCSTDRSLLCRTLSADPVTQTARFVLLHTIAEPHAYVDAVVVGPSAPSLDSLANGGSCAPAGAVPRLRHYLAVACQDRRIRIYSVTKGKPVCSYRASPSEDGALICCVVDPTNTFLASAAPFSVLPQHCPAESASDLNPPVFECTSLPRRTTTVRHSSARLSSSKTKSHSFRTPAPQTKSAIARSNSESANARPPLRTLQRSQLASFTSDISSDDEQIYQSKDSLYQDSSNQDLISFQPEIEQTSCPPCLAGEPHSHHVTPGSGEMPTGDAFPKLSPQRPKSLGFVGHEKVCPDVPEKTSGLLVTCDHCSPSTGFSETDTTLQAMLGTDPAALFHSWTAESKSKTCRFNDPDPMSTSSHEFHRPDSEWNDSSDFRELGQTVQRRISALAFKPPNRASWPDSTCRSSCTSILSASPIIRPRRPLVTRPVSETTFLHALPLHSPSPQPNTNKRTDAHPECLRSTGGNGEEETTKVTSSDVLFPALTDTVGQCGEWSPLSAPLQTANVSSEVATATVATTSRQCLFTGEKSSSNSSESDAVNSELENSELPVITPLLDVRKALDAAISELNRVLGACTSDHDLDEEENELEQCRLASQQFVKQELDRRFCRLRTLLGLEPVCMNSVIAKMLIADTAERLSSQIRLAISDSLPESKDLARLISELISSEIQPDSMAVSTDPPLSCLR
nr:unnamed protein product [Spirometra erinaceieuropaei]